jgi:carboxyl-terminal processing protease
MYKSLLVFIWLVLSACVFQQAAEAARAPRAPGSSGDSSRVERNLKVFDAVWGAVDRLYYDPQFNGVDWERALATYRPQAAASASEGELYRLLNRMLADLRDPHTWALSPDDVKRRKAGRSVDLGFTGQVVEGRLVITRVREGSSARKAGIEPGWVMTHWDGVPVNVSRLDGFAVGEGQTVRAEFLDWQERAREVQLVAETFTDVPEQNSRLLEGDVLYIRFESFYVDGVGRWLAEALARNRGARACVIDLRGNWGGLANELERALEPLYNARTEFGEFVGRDGRKLRLRVSGRGREAYGGAVFVLVDGGSFSAAELFAAAVQESGRGRVIGRRSGGNALNSIQQSLPGGGELNVSVRDYVTKQGRRIEGRGVEPDVTVTPTLLDLRRNVDRDLERALQLAGQPPK